MVPIAAVIGDDRPCFVVIGAIPSAFRPRRLFPERAAYFGDDLVLMSMHTRGHAGQITACRFPRTFAVEQADDLDWNCPCPRLRVLRCQRALVVTPLVFSLFRFEDWH
jgi:hypothetical protein